MKGKWKRESLSFLRHRETGIPPQQTEAVTIIELLQIGTRLGAFSPTPAAEEGAKRMAEPGPSSYYRSIDYLTHSAGWRLA